MLNFILIELLRSTDNINNIYNSSYMDQQQKILKISIKLYSLNFYKKVEMSKVQFEE